MLDAFCCMQYNITRNITFTLAHKMRISVICAFYYLIHYFIYNKMWFYKNTLYLPWAKHVSDDVALKKVEI